ncbi:hypothetical protein RhiirB3_435900, partial [Rhizophagus irregularis]
MSDILVIEINDDADKIDVDKIDVDKNDDKIFTSDNELHNGKPITLIEISPNEKYLITYSKEDESFVGWNVEDKDKVQLKFDQTVKINKDIRYEITNLCVSDDKKLAYIAYIESSIDNRNIIDTFDMNNKDKKIALSFGVNVYPRYCTFNLKGEFILYSEVRNFYTYENHKMIWIYSTQTKNNKWECKRFYRIPEDYELINIQLYNFMNHTGLFLLPSLFYYTPDKEIKNCWNNKYKTIKYKTKYNHTLFDISIYEPTDYQTKFAFGIQNKRVWKSKFDEKMSKMDFSSENFDELNKENNKIVECDEYLNVHSFNLYTDTVSTLFQKAIDGEKQSTELAGNLIKWDILVGNGQIKLEVFKKINTKWKLINIRIENYYYPYKYDGSDFCNNHYLIASLLFSNDDIVILTTFGILIYTF